MQLNRILLYIVDPHKSAQFYQALGFDIVEETDDLCRAQLNGFEVHLHNQRVTHFPADARSEDKGAGVFIYIEAENLDEYNQSLIQKGLKPSLPKDWPWGKREFVIRDPDRYKLVFYQNLK